VISFRSITRNNLILVTFSIISNGTLRDCGSLGNLTTNLNLYCQRLHKQGILNEVFSWAHTRGKECRQQLWRFLPTEWRNEVKWLRRNQANRKSNKFSFLWTKTWYQNNFKYITVLFVFSKSLRYKTKNNKTGNKTKNNFPWELEKINFKVQWNCSNTGKISSSVSFHQYLQVFRMNFNICFRHLVLLEMISFEKIFKTVAQTFAIQCK